MYSIWDAPEKKKLRLKNSLQTIFYNAALLAIFIYLGVFRQKSFAIIYAVSIVIITLIQLFNSRLNIKKQAQRFTNNEANRYCFSENTYDITESGIQQKNEYSQTRYQWAAFIKKEETADYYFLTTGFMQVLIFPKRIFKTTEEKKQFEKLLLQHISFDAEIGHMLKEWRSEGIKKLRNEGVK